MHWFHTVVDIYYAFIADDRTTTQFAFFADSDLLIVYCGVALRVFLIAYD